MTTKPCARKRLLLTSIHDVGPRFADQIDRLVERIEPHVGRRFAMLVVPDHWGEAPIRADRAFQARLRGWADSGIEMFAHGWFHHADTRLAWGLERFKGRHMTAGEGEFLGLSARDAATRMACSIALVSDVTGRPVTGFIAPAWLYGSGAREALDTLGVEIAEDHLRIWSPSERRLLARGPVVTWASRSRARIASSLAFAAAARVGLRSLDVLRIAVHPGDVGVPRILASIERSLAAAADRTPAAYADLLGPAELAA